jgi:hypothetical protein
MVRQLIEQPNACCLAANRSRPIARIPSVARERLGERVKLRGVAQWLAVTEQHELRFQLGEPPGRLAVAAPGLP